METPAPAATRIAVHKRASAKLKPLHFFGTTAIRQSWHIFQLASQLRSKGTVWFDAEIVDEALFQFTVFNGDAQLGQRNTRVHEHIGNAAIAVVTSTSSDNFIGLAIPVQISAFHSHNTVEQVRVVCPCAKNSD